MEMTPGGAARACVVTVPPGGASARVKQLWSMEQVRGDDVARTALVDAARGALARAGVRRVGAVGGARLGTLADAQHCDRARGRGCDCLGAPGDEPAKRLRLIFCQLTYSELFHVVLSPDYNADHEDHFHIEAAPWGRRPALRSGRPAIH